MNQLARVLALVALAYHADVSEAFMQIYSLRMQQQSSNSPVSPLNRLGCTFREMKAGRREMKRDALKYETKQQKAILSFLYAKKVYDYDFDLRRLRFSKLINPESALGPEAQPMYRKALSRLCQILRPDGDIIPDEEESKEIQSLYSALSLLPQWSDPATSYVVFRDDPLLVGKGDVVVQRVQNSGLCYMHAPVVLQHYLVRRCSENGSIGMIDMSKCIREQFTKKELGAHIFDNSGGHSLEFLRKILEPGTKCFSFSPAMHASQWNRLDRNIMKEFGPALVSQFMVHEDFLKGGRVSFAGSPEGAAVDLHSMVLVGIRDCRSTGQKYFLLQNWWEHEQFVEVREDYFMHCDAVFYFVVDKQYRIPAQYSRKVAKIAETIDVDKAESYMKEVNLNRGATACYLVSTH